MAGITVIVATIGATPGFIPKKEAMLPVPLAARPMEVVLFVQLKTVFGRPPLKSTVFVGMPANTAWSATGFTPGAGLTVTFREAVAEQLIPVLTVTVYIPLLVKVSAAVLGLIPPLQA